MSRRTFDIDMSRRKYDVEKKVQLGILALVVLGAAVALGLGIRAWRMQVRPHITACGFDSHGAYAKVRVDNPLDTEQTQDEVVIFSVAGTSYDETRASVTAPAHGHGTAFVQVGFPWSRLHVKGRTVYVLGRAHENPRFVTKEVALERPRQNGGYRGVSIETVPDDPSILSCSTHPVRAINGAMQYLRMHTD